MPDIKIGLIGGSGLGEAVLAAAAGGENVRRHALETPFGKPSDTVLETNWHGVSVFVLARHGPGHLLNPSQVPYRANVFALKQLGVTHVIASGAVGSLRDEFRPRDLVIPDQIIDRTTRRAGTFFDHAAVHVEFAEPFCPVLRRILMEEGSGLRVQCSAEEGVASGSALNPEPRTLKPFLVHNRGCYVCMEGPAFSTRAESLMHRLWGGDLIGMTAMPEAKLAREAELSYALVALVTDYDCWRRAPAAAAGAEDAADPSVLLKEIIANLKAASDNAMKLIRRAVERIAARPDELAGSPAREALRLAIWSDKSRVPPDEVERLALIWKHYFEQ